MLLPFEIVLSHTHTHTLFGLPRRDSFILDTMSTHTNQTTTSSFFKDIDEVEGDDYIQVNKKGLATERALANAERTLISKTKELKDKITLENMTTIADIKEHPKNYENHADQEKKIIAKIVLDIKNLELKKKPLRKELEVLKEKKRKLDEARHVSPRGMVLMMQEFQHMMMKTMDNVMKTMDNVRGELKTLKGDIGAVKTSIGELKSLKGDVGAMKTSIGELKSLKGDVGAELKSLKGDVGAVKTSIGKVEAAVDILKQDVANVKTDVRTVKTKIQEYTPGPTPVPTPVPKPDQKELDKTVRVDDCSSLPGLHDVRVGSLRSPENSP